MAIVTSKIEKTQRSTPFHFTYEIRLAVIIGLVVAVASLGTQGGFWTEANLSSILVDSAMVSIPAIGMTFVIIAGGIDVSVGAILGLSVTIVGLIYNLGLPIWLATVCGLVSGLIMGTINGTVITFLKISPIITTLGFLSIWSAAIYLFLGGNWITNIPPNFSQFFIVDHWWGIPLAMWVALLLVGSFTWIALKRPWGRYLYAIGSNPDAAKVVGIPVTFTIIGAYALLGVLSSIAGLIHLGLSPLVQATTGSGFELSVIAAVVVGGTDIVGGRGTVYGTLLGAILVEIISDTVILFHIQAFWQGVAMGAIILIAVVSGTIYRQRQKQILGSQDSTVYKKTVLEKGSKDDNFGHS